MLDDKRYQRLTLVERLDFADDLALFRFETDEPVDFVPGQYATLGVHEEGEKRPLLRAYSVGSAPRESIMEFFVELVDEGQLTPKLWSIHEGDTVWMRKKIVGRFVLDTEVQQHVMVATVTGIAPYISIVRDQVTALERGRIDAPHRILILHGASRSWELGTYLDELGDLAETHDWLTYVPTVSRPWEDPDWTGERGRVEDVARKHADAIGFGRSETAVYACGHPQMIDKAQGIFRRAGYAEDRIYEEKYFIERRSS